MAGLLGPQPVIHSNNIPCACMHVSVCLSVLELTNSERLNGQRVPGIGYPLLPSARITSVRPYRPHIHPFYMSSGVHTKHFTDSTISPALKDSLYETRMKPSLPP